MAQAKRLFRRDFTWQIHRMARRKKNRSVGPEAPVTGGAATGSATTSLEGPLKRAIAERKNRAGQALGRSGPGISGGPATRRSDGAAAATGAATAAPGVPAAGVSGACNDRGQGDSRTTAGEPAASRTTAGEPVASRTTAGEPVASRTTAGEPADSPMTFRAMRLLNDAYQGATPLAASRGRAGRRAAARGHSVPPGPVDSASKPDDDAARARLGALVGGGVRFVAMDELNGVPLAAVREGISTRELRALRSPSLSAQAVLDLHGELSSRVEARVNAFVRAHRHCRYLLIVHGKGLHSVGGQGVLGAAVYAALTDGGAAPLVRALARAHGQQGGSGATAVSLM